MVSNRAVYSSECPNYDRIVPVILQHGIPALPDHCQLTPGLPLKPMLAQPTKGVQEVLNRFDGIRFTCEWKYDGERAQIHYTEDKKVSIFSRNQEDNTSKYPDIISRLEACMKDTCKSFILDSECVAWDLETQKIKPFQILSTRKRKDANEADIKVQVCVFMFDLLYLNGEPLVKEPLSKRRSLLREHFKEVPGQWIFAHSLDTNKMEEVQEFLEESVKGLIGGIIFYGPEIYANRSCALNLVPFDFRQLRGPYGENARRRSDLRNCQAFEKLAETQERLHGRDRHRLQRRGFPEAHGVLQGSRHRVAAFVLSVRQIPQSGPLVRLRPSLGDQMRRFVALARPQGGYWHQTKKQK
ncbi:unnamed protein product [Nesidiocoris tenuis]|uniref:DNA ligase n=1 Tax=Nesidiocoris tenuis TaxID=355587 RepID=A0A6H5GDU5_9HEMI|nr:unnamed protein product [Nesidiocoris tenuis]